ncbi:MAG: Mov34/MPN/PAD-1 family protein [Planctomycetaceae bacterium]|nr:Mov34/MPN/PAD-1 family protein [Planctomycetales bacterium]MCB9924333.1 Mov34/MPN/PAD-1 family protein [Planctomycetaceae bacterium]
MPRIKIHIPDDITLRIREALIESGQHECGGIVMGEHVGHEEFRVSDLTIQRKGGTISRFVRAVASFVSSLAAFFDRTNHRYRQFNYLGEWHSHPLFALQPSNDDFVSMREIVDDPEVGANFVILILVRLNNDQVEGKVWSLLPGGAFNEAEVIRNGAHYERQ